MNLRRMPPDRWLAFSVVSLVLIGVWLVYDTTYVKAGVSGDPAFYLKRQAGLAVLGFVAMLIMSRIPYWWLRPLAVPVWYGSLLLLALVLVPGLGTKVNGAMRWLEVPGIGFRIQPSEVAKLALVLYMAHVISRYRDRAFHPLGARNLLIGALVISFVMIALEPDLGTALVIAMTWGAVAIVAGVRARTVAQLFVVGLVGIGLVCVTSPYKRERLLAFRDPWSDYEGTGYQLIQSLVAIGSGGPFGVGVSKGVQKCFYLPEAQTDFIFSTLGEELGFVGCVGLIVLFGLFVSRGIAIAQRTRDPFGALLALGITSWVGFQAILNIGVVSSAVPTTGVPLPFISYGGSSLVVTLASVGVLLSVSKYPDAVVEESSAGRSSGWRDRRARVSGARRVAGASQAQPQGPIRWY
ncbi:MAG: putative lipid II flippase FtsW [Armatimonadota bacterium]